MISRAGFENTAPQQELHVTLLYFSNSSSVASTALGRAWVVHGSAGPCNALAPPKARPSEWPVRPCGQGSVCNLWVSGDGYAARGVHLGDTYGNTHPPMRSLQRRQLWRRQGTERTWNCWPFARLMTAGSGGLFAERCSSMATSGCNNNASAGANSRI